jgi:hypothetical protein
LRFVIGGILVSLFSVLGDVMKPKSFAGLFAAAPSVALASLSLTIFRVGKPFAAIEAKYMIAGALAFCGYAALCVYLMTVKRVQAAPAAIGSLLAWAAAAAALFVVFRRI